MKQFLDRMISDRLVAGVTGEVRVLIYVRTGGLDWVKDKLDSDK